MVSSVASHVTVDPKDLGQTKTGVGAIIAMQASRRPRSQTDNHGALLYRIFARGNPFRNQRMCWLR